MGPCDQLTLRFMPASLNSSTVFLPRLKSKLSMSRASESRRSTLESAYRSSCLGICELRKDWKKEAMVDDVQGPVDGSGSDSSSLWLRYHRETGAVGSDAVSGSRRARRAAGETLLHHLDGEVVRMKATPGSTKTDPRPGAGTRVMIRIT